MAGAASVANAQSLGGAGGIPVYCYNCQTATQNAAISINEQIQAQTRALEEALSFIMRAQEYNAGAREAAIEETRAASREIATLGSQSLPRSSCSVYKATGGRTQGAISQTRIRSDLNRSTVAHNRQSRALPAGEPRQAYSIQRVIEELDDPELMIGQILMEDTPIDPDAPERLADLKRRLNLVAVPFPVVTPDEKEIERIKETGTPTEREQLAASIVLQRRQELSQYVLDALQERNIQRIDPSGMEDILMHRFGSSGTVDVSSKLSPNELDEMLSTYRVNSPDWYVDVADAEDPIKLARDQSMMQAELLNSLWEVRKLLTLQLRLAAFDSVRETSQAGLTGR